MPVVNGRQQAPTLEEIRDDHKNRYRWAVSVLKALDLDITFVFDAACGVGYGSQILAEAEYMVTGYDVDIGAISYAGRYYDRYKDDIGYHVVDLNTYFLPMLKDNNRALVSFETIEHLTNPENLLSWDVKYLVGSVPNQDVTPFDPVANPYHVRHYTLDELKDLLIRTGWNLLWYGYQAGKHGKDAEITKTPGNTIVFYAIRHYPEGPMDNLG